MTAIDFLKSKGVISRDQVINANVNLREKDLVKLLTEYAKIAIGENNKKYESN